MNEVIYLEPDDDIAGVIGRIKEVEADGVSLMIPRGGTIAQSIVNLKLIKREIEKQNKIISLVSGDKISRNLASQVGITVYSSVSEAKAAKPERPKPVEMETSRENDDLIEAATAEDLATTGFVVNHYDKDAAKLAATPKTLAEEINDEKPAEALSFADEPGEISQAEENNEEKLPPMEKEEPETIVISNSVRREAEEKPKSQPSMKPGFKPAKVGSRKKPLLIIIGSFVILALALSYIFLPHASATITLNSNDFSKSYEFSVDKTATEVNSDNSILPAEVQSTQGDLSKDFDATGTQDAGTKASGDIVFYNAYSSTDQQTIPDGSVVSSQGLQFVTSGAVTIPVATSALINGKQVITPGQAKGKIIAQSSGTQYNLTPSKYTIEAFSGDKRMNIYGQTTAALSGGTTKQIKVVSADDITKANASLTTGLTTQLSDQIQTELAKDNKQLLTSTVVSEQVSSEPSAKAGDQADKFTVKLTLKVSGLSFSQTAVKQLIVGKVQKEIGDNQMIINSDNVSLTYDVVSYDKDKGVVKMSAKFDGKTGKKINPDDIKNNIKYKKYGTAKDYITNIDGVKDVDLSVWPSLFARTPLIASRIKITFGYSE